MKTKRLLNPKTLRVARWRQDYDYVSNLNQADKEWLQTFSDEFYGATYKPNSAIHSKEQMRENYKAYESARFDVCNNSSNPAVDAKESRVARQYSPSLYSRTSSDNPEDALIDLIDDKNTQYEITLKEISIMKPASVKRPSKVRGKKPAATNEMIKAVVKTALQVVEAGTYPETHIAGVEQTRIWLSVMLKELEAA